MDLKLGIDIFDFKYQSIRRDLVFGILAAPPCTDFSRSGAQYWQDKDKSGQTKMSIELVRKALEIIAFFDPVFWAIENPVGRLQELVPEVGEPWYFQPYEYGDSWTKKTGIWGQFNKPKPAPVKPKRFSSQGSWIQALGGNSEKTKELRSITAPGFAKAFYRANHKSNKTNKTDMKKFNHRKFINYNKLDVASLPVGIQNKLKIFDRMYEKLHGMEYEDYDELLERLYTLDRELVNDFMEEFGDQIENNDIEENDEDIVERLYKDGSSLVYISDLQNAGFKGNVTSSKYIPVGRYCLERVSTFLFKYKIHKWSN